MEEIWKDIIGYENMYQISSLGNVRSVNRTVLVMSPKRGEYYCPRKGGLMRPSIRNNYLGIGLNKNGKETAHKIHRLVAQAFIINPEKKREVNHIDGNKLNNNYTNLEWSTRSENMIHAFHVLKTKPYNQPRGGKSPNAKKIIEMDLNGNTIRAWESIIEAAREHSIYSASIILCLKGKWKTSHGRKWKYA